MQKESRQQNCQARNDVGSRMSHRRFPCSRVSYKAAMARAATGGAAYSTGRSPLSARKYCQSLGFNEAISSLRFFTLSGLPA